jgi:signal transduction histidine kinase
MTRKIKQIWHKTLVFLHLSPLSLAEKCRIAFGTAVVLVLMLALSIPYMWMGQLTKNAALDAGRARSEMLLRRHFQIKQADQEALAELDDSGAVMEANDSTIRWIRFTAVGRAQKGAFADLTEDDEGQLQQLPDRQKQMIESLKTDDRRDDNVFFARENDILTSNYVRIFRAGDSCISCHNPQGSASVFGRNQAIGAAVIQRPADKIGKTLLMNWLWITVAGLIGLVGAIVTFYMITQRVILRPIRQLRALANNVADGNLDVRSSIKTRDEYEKLADAFNHMLDGLQAVQRKLQEANKQLDDKIAELSERNIELLKANKIKSEFLANISHEFRTPLNAILGFADIIREKGDALKKAKAQRYAENIIAGGTRLLGMINDLLDAAKIEAGKMKLNIEKVSIDKLVKGLVASFSSLTKKNKIKVKLVLDDNIPTLSTDAGKVGQILYNFLSNAVKFTPQKGKIEIRVFMLDEKTVRVSVSDTGCGIAEGDREKIFEKFRQTDGSLTRQSTGSGLGLAISKELAAMLAGSIGLESELGKGATFWLDIPVVLPENQDQTA